MIQGLFLNEGLSEALGVGILGSSVDLDNPLSICISPPY